MASRSGSVRGASLFEVLLNERWAEVDVQLHERSLADAPKAVHLPRLDHQDVAGAGLELFAIHGPAAAPLTNELHFVVWVAMRPRPAPRLAVKEEDRDPDIAVVGTDDVVRAPVKR